MLVHFELATYSLYKYMFHVICMSEFVHNNNFDEIYMCNKKAIQKRFAETHF